jgi:hypothetical protein
MEIFVAVVKYVFIIGVGVEAVLILRALFNLARSKARPAAAPAQSGE